MEIGQVPPWPQYSPVVPRRIGQLATSGAVFDYAGAPPVLELEQEFSQLHQGRHVVSFNSGTSALYVALCALGVTQGDEVIVPNLTFLASASPALWLGALPVLVDSSPDDPSIAPEAIKRAITARTKVVVVTHLFGNPVNIAAIKAICEQHHLRLLEDCSHAHASTVGGKHVGTFGDAAIYSIGAGKLISGGHGGLLVTPDTVVRDVALMLGHFKPRSRTDLRTNFLQPYAEFALGGNLRLSPMAAILALDHLRSINELSRARCDNVAVLDTHLKGLLIPVRSSSPRTNRSHFDIVYLLSASMPTTFRPLILRELQSAGVAAAAPSTRPLNRILRSIPPAPTNIKNTILQRLTALAASAPSDDRLPYSTNLHDRMIALPAARLYHPDTTVSDTVGAAAAHAVKNVLRENP